MATKRRKNADDMSEDEVQGPEDLVDVDFEFFDIQQQDYHAINTLLKQLFSHDATRFDLGKLADIILEQKFVGSTVKCDGHISDPYAFCSVLNLNERKTEQSVAAVTQYILERASSSTLHPRLQQLLATEGTEAHLGLVLSERLVNMPPHIVAPMYKMLEEELGWAIEEKEPYRFSHLLFFSRVFISAGAENGGSAPRTKKKKATVGNKIVADAAPGDVFAYHPEDEVIGKFAEETFDFDFVNAPERDAIDPFGVETRGRIMLVPADKLPDLVQELERWLAV